MGDELSEFKLATSESDLRTTPTRLHEAPMRSYKALSRSVLLATLLSLHSMSILAPTSSALVAAEPHDPATLTRLRGVTYAKRDGVELYADVYMPPGEGPNPSILMVHGGAWAAGSKWNVLFHANQLAQHGYTVAAIDYRLAPKHKFPAQLEDCRAALDWMGKNADKYRIDKSRIGAYGYSAGGHLVSLLAVTDKKRRPKQPSRLRAVVAGGAPCSFDWIGRESRSLAYFLGGSRAEKPTVYQNASPLTFVSPEAPPFFFFHGERDRVVPRSSSDALHQLLRKSGVDSSYHIVPKQGHLPTFFDEQARAKAIKFLDRVLKKDEQSERDTTKASDNRDRDAAATPVPLPKPPSPCG